MAEINKISLQKQTPETYGIYLEKQCLGTLNEENKQILFSSEIAKTILYKKAIQYLQKVAKQNNKQTEEQTIYLFLEKIIVLTEDEKEYRKFHEKGYKIVTITEYPKEISGPIPLPETFASLDEESHKVAEMWIREKKKEWPNLLIKTYKKLDDFIV